MKTFDELLKENNIKKPRVDSNEWLLFDKEWSEVRQLYAVYCFELLKKKTDCAKSINILQATWGKSFPTLKSLDSIAISAFSTPKESLHNIRQSKAVLDNISVLHFAISLDTKARAEWVKELVDVASCDCDLIVIRGEHTPSPNEIQKFNDEVQRHIPCKIEYNGHVVWVAFNPHEKYSTENWAMPKKFSTVEYISK